MMPARTDLAETERPLRAPRHGKTARQRLLIISLDAPLLAAHHLSLACAARTAGYEVHVAASFAPHMAPGYGAHARMAQEAGLTFHPLPYRQASSGVLGALSRLRALTMLINRVKPTLIHSMGIKAVLYAGMIARAKRLSAVHAVEGLGSAIGGTGFAAALRRIVLIRGLAFAFGNRRARVTVGNPDERDRLARLGVIDPRRIFFLHGIGADLKSFHPRALGGTHNEGPLVVMYAAPLTSAWGARDFVAVARRMRAKGTPVRFVLVGAREPQNPDSIGETEMARWLAEGAIEWWRDPSDRPALFRQADIFCLPPHCGESVPNVLIEAAASGLPIVTTDTPGGRQVVRQGANGLLVAPQRDDALEAALARLIGDSEFRRTAGRKSREIAVAEFSLDAVHAVGLGVYRAASGHALVGAPSS